MAGIGEMLTEEGHKLSYSGEDSRHQHGVGSIVSKDNKIGNQLHVGIQHAHHHTCFAWPRIRPSFRSMLQHKIMIIMHLNRSTTEKLEQIITETTKKDLLVITRDWNANVSTNTQKLWLGTVMRCFGLGETTDRGLRLLQFASSHNLTLTNTLFPHKTPRRTTWHAPNDKVYKNDFFLVPQKFKSSINNAQTRIFPGADVGSGHDMVLMTLKLKLKNFKKDSPRIRFNVGKLEDLGIAEIFEAKFWGRFSALNLRNMTSTYSLTTRRTYSMKQPHKCLGEKEEEQATAKQPSTL